MFKAGLFGQMGPSSGFCGVSGSRRGFGKNAGVIIITIIIIIRIVIITIIRLFVFLLLVFCKEYSGLGDTALWIFFGLQTGMPMLAVRTNVDPLLDAPLNGDCNGDPNIKALGRGGGY